MAHGGSRTGSGRKAGAATKKTREIADAAMAEGITPLEFMLGVLRDSKKSDADRFEAAKHAAPYVHAKLSSVDARVQGDVGLTVEIVRFGADQASK